MSAGLESSGMSEGEVKSTCTPRRIGPGSSEATPDWPRAGGGIRRHAHLDLVFAPPDPSPLPRRLRQHVRHPIGRGAQDRTVASVGDKTLPIVSGTPGSSVMAEKVTPELRVGTNGRVSGRVVDAEGRPVPNAQVRLAVGGARGGRMNRATTDRSGAFTLRGLRPRASYTVIAELNDERGQLTGRSDVRAPDTDVRITLGSPDVDPDVETTSAFHPGQLDFRPLGTGGDGRGRRRTGSRQRGRPPARTRRPAPLDLQIEPTSGRHDRFPSTRGASWRREDPSVAASHTSTSKSDPTAAPMDPEMQGTASASEVLPYDDDGVNPLPPALEREAPPEPPAGGDSDPVAPVEDEPDPAIQRRTGLASARRSLGDGPDARSDRPPSPSPKPSRGHWWSHPSRSSLPRHGSSTPEPARPSPPARQRPTWREVASQSPAPADTRRRGNARGRARRDHFRDEGIRTPPLEAPPVQGSHRLEGGGVEDLLPL